MCQGVTQYRSLQPSMEVILVAHQEKHSRTRRLLEADLGPASPRPLGYGLLANPSTIRAIWSRTQSGVKRRVCPPKKYREYCPACRR